MPRFNLPAAPEARPRAGIQCDLSPRALEAWNPGIRAAAGDNEPPNTISIYDPIGFDFFGDGVTAKRIAGALRSIGNEDVEVNINSPGGDVFEGLAIYNLLREHKGRVTVNVMGLAASAASFIAMAGDEIRIGRAAFLMVHNGWVVTMGNRHDLREIADWLEPFDAAIADIYAVRTGLPIDDIKSQLDAETWIGGREAVDSGWADTFLESDRIEEEGGNARNDYRMAARKMDIAMAKAGITRSERRSLMQTYKSGTPSAADSGTPSATDTEADMASAYEGFAQAFARFQHPPSQ
ncbi:head maturation protease, ClpP-related [Kushneria phosphatilytica]|uniref:ATP-dependent Clp protease proteolytic subunit n=1 Tax=Kushneria phosphatilytica TaxID=657387 RepID=A0A1S1NZ10_9GAMM|nr:head maturation protease, ClpP-related [Kushneria phosphatilytica]OHV13003.1 peptidase [Kushneria phosphatilytica]QEL10874.1 Clp protease ClpP [Kushneria phosphatilytica]